MRAKIATTFHPFERRRTMRTKRIVALAGYCMALAALFCAFWLSTAWMRWDWCYWWNGALSFMEFNACAEPPKTWWQALNFILVEAGFLAMAGGGVWATFWGAGDLLTTALLGSRHSK